ncbi:MAG: glutamate--tRNA ligase [Candidatus Colwellbacteria bacterium CG10_big_fil_rev_8_21_14_0_10_42_22]|uniref:Glutamate--tRNA ligase n=1 Tax=Candidatus Colwellbacteria bacterium CG10_big_fil_rev_8_21_14_0_10_42_22 TaxID=1974540 RepID=A0A2H0VFE2_9BACT|nr:MAG: glutamate--tRNA ligase [Candidatus Colwellbacteria bacterium CG10_big_fil_rev_8_21_14_0_10_42_22]
MSSDKKVRVRIAPSPTGPLHIGTARTALFNWLFAKKHKGEFILRIEDTDSERSDKKFEEDIEEGLRWLGLNWDEFYRQSERGAVYEEYLAKLLDSEKAYYCFCSKDELEERRQAMLAQGLAPKYSGRCRAIPAEEARQKAGGGEPYVIRLKVPDTKIEFNDLIRGKIEFDGSLMGDMIIARENGEPLYNFTVAVDDALSEITHIIRGDDHISNTPRQIFIIQALDFEIPEYAHLPMILNPNKSKMSKRSDNVSLESYIKSGYLKGAVLNFLAFMGWHPTDDREIMNIEELIKEFSLKRVQKGGAVFSDEKLDWFNNNHIRTTDTKELLELAKDFVPKSWKLNEAMIESIKGRINRLDELEETLRFYFELPNYEGALLKWQEMNFGEVELNLNKIKDVLDNMDENLKRDKVQKAIMEIINNGSRGEYLWPLRVALSGQKNSPGPFEILEALGKKESVKRVDLALEKLDIPETY